MAIYKVPYSGLLSVAQTISEVFNYLHQNNPNASLGAGPVKTPDGYQSVNVPETQGVFLDPFGTVGRLVSFPYLSTCAALILYGPNGSYLYHALAGTLPVNQITQGINKVAAAAAQVSALYVHPLNTADYDQECQKLVAANIPQGQIVNIYNLAEGTAWSINLQAQVGYNAGP